MSNMTYKACATSGGHVSVFIKEIIAIARLLPLYEDSPGLSCFSLCSWS